MRIAVLSASIGAAVSLALTLFAARHSPPILTVLFALWVLLPFGVLLFAIRRPSPSKALQWLSPALTLTSLPIYGYGALSSAKPKTPIFLLLPAVLLLVIVISILLRPAQPPRT